MKPPYVPPVSRRLQQLQESGNMFGFCTACNRDDVELYRDSNGKLVILKHPVNPGGYLECRGVGTHVDKPFGAKASP